MFLTPEVLPFSLDASKSHVYIGAVGFEDRARAVIERMASDRIKLKSAVGITYVPQDDRNRVDDFVRRLERAGVTADAQAIVPYRRFEPETFSETFAPLINAITPDLTILLDISGMSKFLVAVLLHELRSLDNELVIAYAEAGVYHPTMEVFERRRSSGPPEVTFDFLTTEVNRIVTTTKLGSMAMQGYPLLVIAFPTFNHRELLALVSELSPQKLALIRGIPHDTANAWRADAIDWINRGVKEYISGDELEEYSVSTFEYAHTLALLDTLYHRHYDTHRIVVAPTGSKLQAIAVWLFKLAHPDVQVVYPVTTTHVTELTDGAEAIWQLKIENVRDLAQVLDRHRLGSVLDLEARIRSLRDRS